MTFEKTGEPAPVAKGPGDRVTGATINGSGSLVFRAERVGSDTLLARIVHMVGEAQRTRAPIQRLADLIAAYFVQTVVVIAVLTAVVWGFFGPEPRLAFAWHVDRGEGQPQLISASASSPASSPCDPALGCSEVAAKPVIFASHVSRRWNSGSGATKAGSSDWPVHVVCWMRPSRERLQAGRGTAQPIGQQGMAAVAIRWFGESYGENSSEVVANLKTRHPDVTGLGGEGVVLSLPLRLTNGVDGRQVHDVEAEGGPGFIRGTHTAWRGNPDTNDRDAN